jgi:hypothetical protein
MDFAKAKADITAARGDLKVNPVRAQATALVVLVEILVELIEEDERD